MEQLGLTWSEIAWTAFRIGLILAGGYVIHKAVVHFTRRFEEKVAGGDIATLSEQAQRAKTLTQSIRGLSLILIGGVALLMVLQALHVNVSPLIAVVGIGGLAVGFGGQNLVRDVIAGFFILLENQYTVGDVIKTGDLAGLVESMNLRRTILRDLEGVVHIIPNGEIKTVSNFTVEWSRSLVEIGVAYKENVDEVIEVLKGVCEEMKVAPEYGQYLVDPPEVLGIERFDDSAVTFRILCPKVVPPIRRWYVMRELRRRIKNKFDEVGIEIPFPQRTLWWGQLKDAGGTEIEELLKRAEEQKQA